MNPRWTWLLLPYTRTESPGWGPLLTWAGARGPRSNPAWKRVAPVTIRGKAHRFLMRLDRSNWSQRLTYFLGRYYELGVQQTLDAVLRPGDRFVDIGANIGMITLHARHLVGPTGKIDCFEPNPECVSLIREHLRLNNLVNVVVHPCALADAPGSLVLNFTSEHSGTATLAPVGSAIVRSIVVDVRVGDNELSDAPRMIKLDVEGYELHALRGLASTIDAHKPCVLMEVVAAQLQRAGTRVTELQDFMFERGYAAFGIGSARRFLRHRLRLHPVPRGAGFDGYTDVLWIHRDDPSDVRRHVG